MRLQRENIFKVVSPGIELKKKEVKPKTANKLKEVAEVW